MPLGKPRQVAVRLRAVTAHAMKVALTAAAGCGSAEVVEFMHPSMLITQVITLTLLLGVAARRLIPGRASRAQ